MSQHSNRLPFSQTIEAICCALFLKGYMWACLQILWEKNSTRKNKCLLCNFKMIGIVDVNLSKRRGEKKDVWEGWRKYMYHQSSPLFHTKVRKTEPIFQLLKSRFIDGTQQIPSTTNCYILNIYLFQWNGIFVSITQCPMFVSQL
jgi:hypothetical protein